MTGRRDKWLVLSRRRRGSSGGSESPESLSSTRVTVRTCASYLTSLGLSVAVLGFAPVEMETLHRVIMKIKSSHTRERLPAVTVQ